MCEGFGTKVEREQIEDMPITTANSEYIEVLAACKIVVRALFFHGTRG